MPAARRPGRWLRALFRLPAHLYAHHLGWLLGHRFLQLTHVGRRSGKTYRTVLEVVRYDHLRREAIVASGFGPHADWLLNLQAGGSAQVTIGRETFSAGYRILPAGEAAAVLANYERRNRYARPVVNLVLSRLLGWRYDGSPASRQRAAQELPMIALTPRDDDQHGPAPA